MRVMFWDTETTGIPEWQKPSDDTAQPHLVQLAAIVVEDTTREIVEEMNVLIQPINWTIPQETIDVHGITNERAMADGILESVALNRFIKLWNHHKQLAYNTTFDRRVIRIGLARYMNSDIQDAWHACDYECVMIMAKKFMGASKYQKLSVAYKHMFGIEPENQHDAMYDIKAAMQVYFAIKDARLLMEKN